MSDKIYQVLHEERNAHDLVMYNGWQTWGGIAAREPIKASKPLIAQALRHGQLTAY